VKEPEFLLPDKPVPAPGDPQVRALRRAGRHGIRKSVLIRMERYRHPRRLLVLVLVVAAAGAAAVLVVRRRTSQGRNERREVFVEEDHDTLAMREPPISAV